MPTSEREPSGASPQDDVLDLTEPVEIVAGALDTAEEGGASPGEIDLSGLPIVGITRRRVAFLAAAFVTAWIVVAFARQVGEASAATTRAEQLRGANVELAGEVAALESELQLIQRQQYIAQQARGYRLGAPDEIPFTLSPNAPALGPDAPGSAAVRLGAGEAPITPLESWLSLLFGPER
jgi:cell division protein FtsB